MSVTTHTTHEVTGNAWNHIFSQGFIELPIDPAFLNGVVPTIMEGMTRMTTNPSYAELFKLVILGTDEVGWGQDSGLIRRSDDEKKWFFHYCGDITYSHLDASGAPCTSSTRFLRHLQK